jgi:MGT family glycosyltransferase
VAWWLRKQLVGLNALRQLHGVTPLSHFMDQIGRARRQLVLTSAAFAFAAVLPPGARYVGPVLDDPVWAAETPWTPPDSSDPLVLVAMSSTFQDQIDCLQRVVDALAILPVRGLVTTGPAIDASALQPRANVTIVPSAPHRQVLQHAALVVTHGGHGTVMKALEANVPMVLVPHGRDQADTAARVTSRGAGITLRRTATPGEIADAVRQVLQNGQYRTSTQQLGDAVRRDANSDAVICELEDISDGDEQSDRNAFASAGESSIQRDRGGCA